jgi:pimeloyl-ACP methyl ester carboxylesterase
MTTFNTVTAGGLQVFYREAGDPDAPKLLLLGGFPSSSHQFRNLLPALADRFHLVSFDYPGFGNTEMPDPASWDYTFDHLTEVVDAALEAIGFTGEMGMYMQDYGGPIGNRLIGKHPSWLQWQVIQNANAYDEGFTEVWDGIRHALWANRNPQTEAPLEAFLSHDTVKAIYLTGHRNPGKISPDNWNMDLFFLSRPNAHRVQLDLFYDYRTNAIKSASKIVPRWKDGQLVNPSTKTMVWNHRPAEYSVAAIQEGDVPEDWAALTHQLRWAAPHYDHATALLWPLMVARKLAEYVMPVQLLEEIAEGDDTDAAPEDTS